MTFNKQDILDAFKRRVATRYYDGNRKISDEDMKFILELGRLSPRSIGSEPWRFVVVQNPALREAIKPVGWGGNDWYRFLPNRRIQLRSRQ